MKPHDAYRTPLPAVSYPRDQLPTTLTVIDQGDANHYALVDDDTGDWLMSLLLDGRLLTDKQRAILHHMAACWNCLSGMSLDEIHNLSTKLKEKTHG